MFSLFQILTGDGWTDIVRPLLEMSIGSAAVGAFFISYIIVVSMILVQVVIALLLTEFDSLKESDPTEMLREQAMGRHHPQRKNSPFHPLVKDLLKFSDVEDLKFRVCRAWTRIAKCPTPESVESVELSFEAFARGIICLNVIPAVGSQIFSEKFHAPYFIMDLKLFIQNYVNPHQED